MSRIPVSEHVLRWALERSRLDAQAVAARFPRIHEWLSGSVLPTMRQLDLFAKATCTPLGYLFLDEPPVECLPIPDFRTLDGTLPREPSPDLLDTIYMMQRRQSWMRETLEQQGAEPLAFVGSARLGEEPEAIAQEMREKLGLSEGWAASQASWLGALQMLRTCVEDAGVLVVTNSVVGNNTHRRLCPEEFRGFVLVDEYAPLLFVNGADGKAAQLFTLAHELAHVFFGSSGAFDLRAMQPTSDPLEQACNRAAAEFLVPEAELQRVWGRVSMAPEPIQEIARHFRVSSVVAARRALDMGLMSKEEFSHFYTSYLKDERRTQAKKQDRRGDFYASQNLRVGRRFASEVIRATAEGQLLFTEAFALTELHGKTFREYARRLEMGGLL